MGKTLLSIDWDYFIPTKREWFGSYLENRRNLIGIWYQRYLKAIINGEDLLQTIHTGPELQEFWKIINDLFKITDATKVYVSDSHKYSYFLAKINSCSNVYLFDAHSDLGYGGLPSLEFELNHANWLGKLLKEGHISRATIIYSPYTYEKKEQFQEINNAFDIDYSTLNDYRRLKELPVEVMVAAIHICRSGVWTPPWLDDDFSRFIRMVNLPIRIFKCPERNWNPESLTLADKIDYLLCI